MRSLRHTSLLPTLACALAFAAPAGAATGSKWEQVPIAHASGASSCTDTDKRPGAASQAVLAQSAVCLINKQRSQRGLRKLRLNSRLSTAALHHSVDMVKRNYFAHTSRSGADVVDRLRRAGYLRGGRSWTVGENLAWGSGARSTPKQIVAAWMNSPGHRANILQRRFREIGIGVVFKAPQGTHSAAATYTTTFGARG